MRPEDLIALLSEGQDDATKAAIVAAVNRESVKVGISGYKAKTEFDTLMAERTRLAEELEGNAANKVPGTREYKTWYEKNAAAAIENDNKIREFDAKHGAGAFAKALAGELPTNPAATTTMSAADIQALIDAKVKTGVQASPDDIKALIDKRFHEQYAPSTANTVVTAARLMQKHFRNKRENDIDFDSLAKLANEKFAGNMEQAYDEWDKPEREKVSRAQSEAEFNTRLTAEKQKWDDERLRENANKKFPAGGDVTPGALMGHKDADKFDKNSLVNDLAGAWATAGEKVQ